MEYRIFKGGPWDGEVRVFSGVIPQQVEAWGGEYILVEWPDIGTWYQWKPKEMARA